MGFLSIADFSYNNSTHSSTQMTPFFALRGYHPRFDPTVPSVVQVPRVEFHASSFKDLHDWL
jgi:hypothetical protein